MIYDPWHADISARLRRDRFRRRANTAIRCFAVFVVAAWAAAALVFVAHCVKSVNP